MAMPEARLTLYFDLESPFSYLAYELLLRNERAWAIDLQLKCVQLGGIFRSTGNQPPAVAVPSKGKYAFNDLSRRGELFSVPYSGSPSNSLARGAEAEKPYFKVAGGNRMVAAAIQRYGGKDSRCRRLISKMYHTVFVEYAGKPLLFTAAVLESVARASGFSHNESTSLVVDSEAAATKELVKVATAEAANEGAFGVPYMVLDGPNIPRKHRCWFGSDVLPIIAQILGKQFVRQPLSRL